MLQILGEWVCIKYFNGIFHHAYSKILILNLKKYLFSERFYFDFLCQQHYTYFSNSQHTLRFSLQRDTENHTLFYFVLVDKTPFINEATMTKRKVL